MQSVLLTDGLLRKSLTATKSLGKRGIKTVVGETSWFSPSGFSKYCHKRVKYPDPKTDSGGFLSWLLEQLKQADSPVFLPMDDVVMDIVMDHLAVVRKQCRCLLPTKKAYDVAADKYETMKLAMEQQVACPASYLPKHDKDLEAFSEAAVFPVIIKPRNSSGSRGIRKAENKEALIKLFYEVKKEYPDPFILECIPLGVRYDVCLLYDQNHEVKASFVQKEIRHFPIEMGPSTVQESVLQADLITQSIRLLEPLNWCGIVEVEYMVDPRNDEPILMEINPRFWNSLDLAVRSGIDFPYLLYQLCLNEEISTQTEYPLGRMSRWLFPGDLLHFLFNPERFAMKPAFFSGKKQAVYDDTFEWGDPLPGLIWIVSCLRFAFSIKSLKMFFKR